MLISTLPTAAQDGSELPVITPENADRLEQLTVLGRGYLHDMAWSPDGRWLAAASSHGIYIYNSTNWAASPLLLNEHVNAVTGIDFSPDGHTLASLSGGDATVILWDTTTWKSKTHYQASNRKARYLQSLGDIALHPNSSLLALTVQGTIEFGDLQIWDLIAGKPVFAWGNDTMIRPQFSPDGKYLATVYKEGGINLWDVNFLLGLGRTQEFIDYPDPENTKLHDAEDKNHISENNNFAFSPDSQTLATSGCKIYPPNPQCLTNTITLWDTTSKQQVRQILTDYTGGIYGVAFGSDEQTIAASGCLDELPCENYAITLWNSATGEEIGFLQAPYQAQIDALAFNPTGNLLAVKGKSAIYIWDINTTQLLTSLDGYGGIASEFLIHPTKPILISAHYEPDTIHFWHIGEKTIADTPFLSLPGSGPVSINTEGTILAADSVLWDITNPAEPVPLNDYDLLVKSGSNIVFRPNSSIIALNSSSKIEFVDLQSRQKLVGLETEFISPPGWKFSPDGRWLNITYSGGPLKLVRVDDLLGLTGFDNLLGINVPTQTIPNPAKLASTLDQNSHLDAAVFSPDSTILAASYSDQHDAVVILWDIESGQELQQLPGFAGTLTFSPDGQLLATSSCTTPNNYWLDCEHYKIELWDLANGKKLTAVEGHTETIRSLQFSLDGSLLASGSGHSEGYYDYGANTDDTIRIWGVK